MPNTREKLIELLYEAEEYEVNTCMFHSECEDCPGRKYGDNCRDCLKADRLIANGVTVQKWIPVSERLPEDDSDVLAYLRIGEERRIYPANYAKGMWFDCIFNTPATENTTHWMPLPQPPVDMSRMFENVSIDDLRSYREKTQPPKGE